MKITEEMLYMAAPEAAERYLDTLPGRAECAHTFSPAFEEKMRALLPRRKKRKVWKKIVLLAAVVALLGTAVYANQPEDYRVQATARDGMLTYSARPQDDVVPQQFHQITFGWLPEGYELWDALEIDENSGYSSISYRTEDYNTVCLQQWMGREYGGVELGELQWEEVTVRGSAGIYVTKAATSFLLWAEGPYVLRLDTDPLDRETVMKIAENLTW